MSDRDEVDRARHEADEEFDERAAEIQDQVDSITAKVNEALEEGPSKDEEPLA